MRKNFLLLVPVGTVKTRRPAPAILRTAPAQLHTGSA
jgi:hypothetical protein